MLGRLPKVFSPDLLVGFETSDDAGVFKLTPELALVQTVDFFTPIVDDAFQFGAIAAANSLSDVYAMGGRPLTALSILAYPGGGDLDILQRILEGGLSKMREAGCTLAGGHSVNDPEIKFGYAVTGMVHPDRIWKNSGAQAGDCLVFSKALGTGVIATAGKRELAAPEHLEAMIASMMMLNRDVAEAAVDLPVHGATDVTGFGFLGHAREMALGSQVTLEIDASSFRWLPGALEYAAAGAIPGGLKNNREFASDCVDMDAAVPEPIQHLLYDPQTSGGLLLALPLDAATELLARRPECYLVGRVGPRSSPPIRVSWSA